MYLEVLVAFCNLLNHLWPHWPFSATVKTVKISPFSLIRSDGTHSECLLKLEKTWTALPLRKK